MTGRKVLDNVLAAEPFLIMAVFAALFAIFFSALGLHDFSLTAQTVADFKHRLYWGLSVVFLLMSVLWSLTNSMRLVRRHSCERHPKAFLVICVVLTLIGLTAYFVNFDMGGGAAVGLQEGILSSTSIDIRQWTRLINAIVTVTVIALILALSMLAIEMRSDDMEIQDVSVEIRQSLYASSVLLASGTLEVFALFSWSSAVAGDAAVAATASKALIIAASLLFTFMLLLLYVPLFARRNARLRAQLKAENFASAEELANWYAVRGVERFIGARVQDVAAYLLPIATGVAVNLISANLT